MRPPACQMTSPCSRPFGVFPRRVDSCSFSARCLIPTSFLCRPEAVYSDTSLRTWERISFPLLEVIVSWQIVLVFLPFTKAALQFISSFPVFSMPQTTYLSPLPTLPYLPYLPFCWWLAFQRIVLRWHRGWWTRWTNSTFSVTVENRRKQAREIL